MNPSTEGYESGGRGAWHDEGEVHGASVGWPSARAVEGDRRMRRGIAALLATGFVGLVAGMLAPGSAPALAASRPFRDVAGVLAPEVTRAQAVGLVTGYADGTFKPDRPITRAEFVKIGVTMMEKVLGRSLPAPEWPGELFRDVGRDHPHYTVLVKALRGRYIWGDAENRFRPDHPLRRLDAANMLASMLRYLTPQHGRTARFRDVDPSDPLLASVGRVAAFGIFKGFPDGSFRPEAFMTRAQAAAVVLRAYDVRRRNPAPLGTWENPVPLGQAFTLGSWWRLTVVDIVEDAWPWIREAHPDARPPVPGRQYVMARLRLTYLGDPIGNRRSPIDLSMAYEGSDGSSFGRWEPGGRGLCGPVPDELPWFQPLEPGATVEGNVCWAVPGEVVRGG